MKIKSLYIDGYKNLKQTQIHFKSKEIPLVIIGNNGTGKSNLLEALIQIFIGLYNNSLPTFQFNITYEVNNKNVKIEKAGDSASLRIVIDGNPISRTHFTNWIREVGNMPPFPELIFCYYSGTCNRTRDLIKRYDRKFNLYLRRQTNNLDRLFVFSDIKQAQWTLLGLFAHRHLELLTRLSLSDIQRFKITLMPPENYAEDTDDPKFWGTTGAIRDFLADLDVLAIESQSSSSFDSQSRINLRTYVFNRLGLEKIGSYLERRSTNFQSMMQALSYRKIVAATKFELVNSKSGATYSIDDLSEGEKQLLCVIGGLKLYNQSESLVLLDEPDTHLNPVWSWEYESLLKYALSDEQKERSSVLLASHDPIIISGLTKEQVLIAGVNENSELNYFHPVRDPRGQGVANVLTSEFFGLPSSLDKHTQNLLDERLSLAYKKTRLEEAERARLKEINEKLDILGLSISFRDPEYKKYEETKYKN